MQTQELTITHREGTGKQVAKRLRRNGVVPGVLYGGTTPESVAVDPRAVLRIIHGRGIGVQREIVHSMLKEHRAVISFRDAADRGSTYVLLRPGPLPAVSPDAP